MCLNHSVDVGCAQPASTNPFTPEDVAAILRERGWLDPASPGQREAAVQAWLVRAAELLSPHAASRAELAALLDPIFVYDAAASLREIANQDVLSRSGAREVIRELANRVMESDDLDSDRFKQIVESMKEAIPYRSRAMFHPIRIAFTGRVGEGELDRVILLVDPAARLSFAVPVKTTRQRMLEFCAALD